MRIKKNKTHARKKVLLGSLLAVTIASASYLGYAYTADSWPFNQASQETAQDQEDTSTPNDKNPAQPQNPTDNSGEPGTGNQPKPDDGKYVDVPITNPPEVNDPYPIENQHYKITQKNDTTYHVTLYPIANNPEYSNYNAQLKAYKNEALSYLKKRYGTIDNLTITWTPTDAEDT